MPAVQHRYGEKIDEAEVYRKDRNQDDRGHEASLRHLTGNLSDTKRTTELAETALSGDNLIDRLERGAGDNHGFFCRPPDCRCNPMLHEFHAAALDPEAANLLLVAQTIIGNDPRRGGRKTNFLTVALDAE